MARDDRFKRYQEAGADFLETARTRAEEFLRELAKMGDSTQKQAQGAVDELVEGGRKGTDQIVGSIRREITAQLSQLGLATKEDLAALERRLTSGAAPAGSAGPAGGAEPVRPAATAGPAVPAPGPTAVPAPAPGPAAVAPTPPKKAPPAKVAKKVPATKIPATKIPGESVPAKKVAAKKGAPAKKAADGV